MAGANGEALAFQADKNFAKDLSTSERRKLSQAEMQALDFAAADEPILWQGARKSVSGKVTAYQPFRVGNSNCRRFSHVVVSDEKENELSATACKNKENSWQLIQ